MKRTPCFAIASIAGVFTPSVPHSSPPANCWSVVMIKNVEPLRFIPCSPLGTQNNHQHEQSRFHGNTGGMLTKSGRRGKRNQMSAPVWLLDIESLVLYLTVARTMRTPTTARDSCRMLPVLLAIFPWSAFAAPRPLGGRREFAGRPWKAMPTRTLAELPDLPADVPGSRFGGSSGTFRRSDLASSAPKSPTTAGGSSTPMVTGSSTAVSRRSARRPRRVERKSRGSCSARPRAGLRPPPNF